MWWYSSFNCNAEDKKLSIVKCGSMSFAGRIHTCERCSKKISVTGQAASEDNIEPEVVADSPAIFILIVVGIVVVVGIVLGGAFLYYKKRQRMEPKNYL